MKLFIAKLISIDEPSHLSGAILAIVAFLLIGKGADKALAAEDLKLRNGISFVQDTDAGFPILASKIDDCAITPGLPTFIFFGASADLNTNRQAKRVVDFYRRYSSKLKFIVIDVDQPTNPKAVKLIKTYYKGYIPFEVLLTKSGTTKWSQTGEVDTNILKAQVEQIL